LGAARPRFSGADRKVTPGPFPAINELVAGFWSEIEIR
jgi:hypothetical protein